MTTDLLFRQFLESLVLKYPRGYFRKINSKRKYMKNSKWIKIKKFQFLLNWINKQTPLLQNTIYNIATKIYWIRHNITDFPKCQYCGKTIGIGKNVKLNKGYPRFCCNSHAQLSDEIQTKIKATNQKNLGVNYPMQSKTILLKSIKTCIEKENCINPSQFLNTRKLLKLAFQIKTKNEKEAIINKREKTVQKKYNVRSILQLNYIRNKNTVWDKYFYNNELFDSSWELAFYIWHIDNNISIKHEPKIFTYYDLNNKSHRYTPDFEVNGQIYEIKGDNHFDNNGNPIYKGKSWKLKYDFILSQNIKILKFIDIKMYLDYCCKKYNNRRWFIQFKIPGKRKR